MEHAGLIEMGSQKHFPEVIQRLERPGFAKDNQVEPAVVVARRRHEREAQGIARGVENEYGRAGQDFFGAWISIRTVIGGNW